MLPTTELTEMNASNAERRLEELISLRSDLTVVPASRAPASRILGPVTEGFFSKYSSLSTATKSLEIALDSIAPSSYFDGCFAIGHYEYWELVIKPGEDIVYVVDGSEADLSETDARYENIYEYLVDELAG